MSSDLLTNASAMTAILALNQTQSNMNTFENQVSTGLAISSAQDNAAFWSIGSSMSSQVDSLNAVSSSLSESSSLLSTMTAALQQAITVLNNINTDLITAQGLANEGDTTDLQDTQNDITQQIQALVSLGESTDVNGVNFLVQGTGSTTVNLLSSYNPSSGSQFIQIDTTTTALFGTQASLSSTGGLLGVTGAKSNLSILNFSVTGANATPSAIANMIADLSTTIENVRTAASVVGADQNNVAEQQNYISNLTDSLTSAVGSLVDADMNEASTKISALQVQQQLGVQALSIANSNTQLILKLFGQ